MTCRGMREREMGLRRGVYGVAGIDDHSDFFAAGS